VNGEGERPLLITDPGGFGEIEDEWRALAEQRENAFVTPDWARAWWQRCGQPSTSLLIVALRRDGKLIGVMPLAHDDSARPRAIRFAGAGLGDRFHPVARPEDEPAVAAAAMEALEARGLGRRMLLLEHAHPHSPWVQSLRESARRRLKVTEQPPAEMPFIRLEGLDWEAYVGQRSKNFRAEIRRRERVMRRDHGMSDRLATAATLESDLDELFRLHALRWQGRDESPLTDPAMQGVLRDFAASALSRGWLRLHVLEAEGAPVAAMLAWRIGDSYAYFNSGFDPAWSQKSIGTVLMSVAIRSAIEEEAREFDFLLGGEAYKHKFTPDARTSTNLVLTPALAPTSLLVAVEARARQVGRRVAEVPGLGRLARRGRKALPTARP
jgi:CelD/BcsL family acetyltransferase involved in cellulose biosynthesis